MSRNKKLISINPKNVLSNLVYFIELFDLANQLVPHTIEVHLLVSNLPES